MASGAAGSTSAVRRPPPRLHNTDHGDWLRLAHQVLFNGSMLQLLTKCRSRRALCPPGDWLRMWRRRYCVVRTDFVVFAEDEEVRTRRLSLPAYRLPT